MKTRSQSKAAPAASVTTSTTSPAPKSVVSRPSRKKSLTTGNGNGASSENQVITSLDENVSVTSSSPQEDQIAARAYQIWLENGQREGCHEENWHQARRELSSSTVPVG